MKPLIIAIDLPHSIKEQLERLCYGLPSVNWSDPDDFHLTIKHFGKVDGALYKDIKQKLCELEAPPFELQLEGVGHSHSKNARGALWSSPKDPAPIISLKVKINQLLEEFSLPQEQKEQQFQVVLGRYQKVPDHKLLDYLAANSAFQTAPFTVEALSLMSHEANAKHAFCKEHESYPLGTPPEESPPAPPAAGRAPPPPIREWGNFSS